MWFLLYRRGAYVCVWSGCVCVYVGVYVKCVVYVKSVNCCLRPVELRCSFQVVVFPPELMVLDVLGSWRFSRRMFSSVRLGLMFYTGSPCSSVFQLATCHHCPITPTRRGLVYRDSLSGLCRNLRTSPWTQNPRAVRLHDLPSKPPHRLPQSSALSHPKRTSSLKQLVLTHLRRLFTLSPAHRVAGWSQTPRATEHQRAPQAGRWGRMFWPVLTRSRDGPHQGSGGGAELEKSFDLWVDVFSPAAAPETAFPLTINHLSAPTSGLCLHRFYLPNQTAVSLELQPNNNRVLRD